MGLIVDKPKPGGSGNSNDGNTARRFFSNPETSSEITGVDLELIKRLRNILISISCSEQIDPEKFRVYCIETADLYVKLYPWYHMPTAMHRILIHGHKIIQASVLPIGRMTEEAQEKCNKDIKDTREHFTRKNSRENTNRDIINRLLISSDPVINAYFINEKHNDRVLPEEVQFLIKDTKKKNDTDEVEDAVVESEIDEDEEYEDENENEEEDYEEAEEVEDDEEEYEDDE